MEQLTLNEIINQLTSVEQDANVYFDFASFAPYGLFSYRGYYQHLSLGFSNEKDIKVSELIVLLEDAIGKYFTGYKGGEFMMQEDTPVWVSEYGKTGSTAIHKVSEYGGLCILETFYIDD